MKKIRLGNSDVVVSAIGLGAINFGTKTDKDKAFAILDAYVERGGNFIDTANNYAVWNGGDGGESERVIGAWLSTRKNRENIKIATKIGALATGDKTNKFTNMQGLKREVILKAVEQSLLNLQTSYIDLLYLHVDDFSVPQLEVMQTLHELIQKGKIKAIGCSNFYTWRMESAREICTQHKFTFFSVIQQRFSYLSPLIDANFYPQIALNQDLDAYLRHYKDITLVAYSPLLKGQYTKLNQIIDEKYDTIENMSKLRNLQKKENPIHEVCKYINESYQGSIALITTSNPEHIIDIMKAL